MWQDNNLNGISETEELSTLKQLGIKSISLETKPDDRIIEGNTITETSSFTYEDGRTFKVVDVHYHNDDMDYWYKGRAIKALEREDKFGDEIEKFRAEAAKSLNEEVHKCEEKALREDWIAIILKVKVEEFVANY